VALTNSQMHWLQWLHKNGGVGFLRGSRIVAGGEESNVSASLPFLNLLLKGYLGVDKSHLIITEKGRAMVNPFYRQRHSAAEELMMSVRAKMVCQSVEGGRVKFSCQYDERINAEDAGFTKATPSGSAEYQIDNPKAIEQFQAGKAYYFDITPAD
jgi:hypothetical protein